MKQINEVKGEINVGYTKSPEEDIIEIKRSPSAVKTKENPKEKRYRLFKQTAKMLLVGLGKFGFGSMLTFSSVVASDLKEYNTTITGAPISLTDYQLDMLGSFVVLFSILGALLIAPVLNLIGRRLSMMACGLLVVTGWLGAAVFPGEEGLLVAGAICGVAMGSITVAINIYTVEIPDQEIRGIIFIMVDIGVQAGQMVTMAAGCFARYYVVALLNTIPPAIFVLSQICLPESPTFLVVKGRLMDAKKVLLELRGPSADIDSEMKIYQDLNQMSQKETKSSLKQLFSLGVIKNISIVTTLFVCSYFTGYLVINANASRMFAAAGSTVDEKLAALLTTVVQLISAVVASFFIDRCGRAKTLILSFSITFFSLAAMSVYSAWAEAGHLQQGWIPVVCLTISQAAVALGVAPIPFILSYEYFPTSVRSQAGSICYTIGTLFGVAVMQVYTPMNREMTQAGLYAFYAFFGAAGVAFSYFIVRETKGKNVG